jgi:hypothetical protein
VSRPRQPTSRTINKATSLTAHKAMMNPAQPLQLNVPRSVLSNSCPRLSVVAGSACPSSPIWSAASVIQPASPPRSCSGVQAMVSPDGNVTTARPRPRVRRRRPFLSTRSHPRKERCTRCPWIQVRTYDGQHKYLTEPFVLVDRTTFSEQITDCILSGSQLNGFQ